MLSDTGDMEVGPFHTLRRQAGSDRKPSSRLTRDLGEEMRLAGIGPNSSSAGWCGANHREKEGDNSPSFR